MMDTGEVFEIIAGHKKFEPADIIPIDWANLILGRCNELRPHLGEFYMLKPISQLMMGYFNQISRPRREWHVEIQFPLNPPRSFTLLDFETLKSGQGITEQTRIVPLFYIMNPETNGYGGAIILTEAGTLHEWNWFGKKIGEPCGEEITKATMEPFTIETMRETFKRGYFQPYTIYNNLSHLPRLQARHTREYLAKIEELSGSFIALCNLIKSVQ